MAWHRASCLISVASSSISSTIFDPIDLVELLIEVFPRISSNTLHTGDVMKSDTVSYRDIVSLALFSGGPQTHWVPVERHLGIQGFFLAPSGAFAS